MTTRKVVDLPVEDLAALGFLRELELYEGSQGRRLLADEDNHGVVAFNILARSP